MFSTNNTCKLLFLISISFFISTTFNNVFSQEKARFLKHRYDGYSELITKKSSKNDLENFKNRLERQGVIFTYSNLRFNKKNEIVSITVKLKNSRSKISSKWNQKNIPIPNIRIGEFNGIVSALIDYKKLDVNSLNN